MAFEKKYDYQNVELTLMEYWQAKQIYAFEQDSDHEVFAIDTPPPTVSGFLHLGHVYSYSHTDIVARFKRMQGWQVYYPMGFDDNGLPTERFVEKLRGVKIKDLPRGDLRELCLQVSEMVEKEYTELWQRLGLSVDWHYSYRTIDENSQRISQWSFLDLARKGKVYHRLAPGIWCPECRASFAQADLDDATRKSEFVTLKFTFPGGATLPVATTRPELLAACVAIFVHPSDPRYTDYIGLQVAVPYYGHSVPILVDPGVDKEKGTGAVMCCTFGDAVDVSWWHTYQLDHINLIAEDGKFLEKAGPINGMSIHAGREKMKVILDELGLILSRQDTTQKVRVHERCDSPVEYRMIYQWFVNILEEKPMLLALGDQLNWYPEYMKSRYMNWVENLNWDWCLSRQRNFGVPFPVWYCLDCGEVYLADEEKLPVDPIQESPNEKCRQCGGSEFQPERDVMDTWATSSMSPQIVGQWLIQPEVYKQVFPFTLRPQAHDIIRTWVFYTVVKSYFHFGCLPWRDVAISGWGIAGEGMGKISKSKGGGPMQPKEVIERYSADALRYWAASTGPGKDAVISEEKIQSGQKLVNKIWNVSRFAARFLSDQADPINDNRVVRTPADEWILARLQKVIQRTTDLLSTYDYAAAKNEIEFFFWHDFADNYLEMSKQRLYDPTDFTHSGAVITLKITLLTILKLFAPFLPYVTEKVYLSLFLQDEDVSIHRSQWPQVDQNLVHAGAEETGEILLLVAGAVRRFKSQHNLSLGQPINKLQLATVNEDLKQGLMKAVGDLKSITRAQSIEFVNLLDPNYELIIKDNQLEIGIESNGS